MLAEGILNRFTVDSFLIDIQAILQTRLYALYSLDKKVLAFMLTCFTLSVAASAYIMGSVLSRLTSMSLYRIHFTRTVIQLRPSDSAGNIFAICRNVLLGIERRFELLHVLDTIARV